LVILLWASLTASLLHLLPSERADSGIWCHRKDKDCVFILALVLVSPGGPIVFEQLSQANVEMQSSLIFFQNTR